LRVASPATRLSGPFKFDLFDPTGKVLQSGSGTVTATRFVIPKP